jgi:hypothetical protein
VRLADGPHKGIGRIEVLHNGQWGSVCDTNWDDNDAVVICKMLSSYPFERYLWSIHLKFFFLSELILTIVFFNSYELWLFKTNNTALLAITSFIYILRKDCLQASNENTKMQYWLIWDYLWEIIKFLSRNRAPPEKS